MLQDHCLWIQNVNTTLFDWRFQTLMYFSCYCTVPQKKKKKSFVQPGTRIKKCLINVIYLINGMSTDHIEALLSLNAFARYDSTNCFKGLGKIKPLQMSKKLTMFQSPFAWVGNSWEVPSELIDDLDAFTCVFMVNLESKMWINSDT